MGCTGLGMGVVKAAASRLSMKEAADGSPVKHTPHMHAHTHAHKAHRQDVNLSYSDSHCYLRHRSKPDYHSARVRTVQLYCKL